MYRSSYEAYSAGIEATAVDTRAKKLIHKSFADTAEATGSEDEQLERFRQIRDEIKDWISMEFGK